MVACLRGYRRKKLSYILDVFGLLCLPVTLFVYVAITLPGNASTGSGHQWFLILSALSALTLPIGTIAAYILAGRVVGRYFRWLIERLG